LKDHIRTLKEFLEEKSKLSEMYKNENLSLREKLSKHEGNVGVRINLSPFFFTHFYTKQVKNSNI
jgi:hypothetical protein